MKNVVVQFYAALREKRGLTKETVKTKAVTVKDLYLELDQKSHFSISMDILKVAVNDSFVDWNRKIKTGDKILFIPPVAGG